MLYIRKLQLFSCNQIACDTLLLALSCAMLIWLNRLHHRVTAHAALSFWTYKSISFAELR